MNVEQFETRCDSVKIRIRALSNKLDKLNVVKEFTIELINKGLIFHASTWLRSACAEYALVDSVILKNYLAMLAYNPQLLTVEFVNRIR